MISSLAASFRAFLDDRRGNIAITFALFSVPTTFIVGMAIDYGSMNRTAAHLQTAVDSAVLTAASKTSGREEAALNSFRAMTGSMEGGPGATITITDSGGTLKAKASMTVRTSVMKLAGIDTITITREATATTAVQATAGFSDRSCILGLGLSNDASNNAFVVQSATKITLTDCELRSHASMDCDGMETGATAIFAGRAATACKEALLNQAPIPDIYNALAGNIQRVCGTEKSGVNWNLEKEPDIQVLPRVLAVNRSGYREVHVCGQLTLSGSGSVNSTTPSDDLVIVVENGGIKLAKNAAVDARQVTFVLAGGNGSAAIAFPKAAAKQATLVLSPSLSPSNPWAGVSAYQNPAAANGVDMAWKAGANLSIDGIAYFPNAKLTIAGAVASGDDGCTKLIAGAIQVQGSLTIRQSPAACKKLQARQYEKAGKPAVSAYLTK